MGQEELLRTIIYSIFAILIPFMLLIFIYVASTGLMIKEQMLAKQIALSIDAAKPGTEIFVQKGNMKEVKLENGKVFVAAEGSNGKSYRYFSKYEITLDNADEIRITIGGVK